MRKNRESRGITRRSFHKLGMAAVVAAGSPLVARGALAATSNALVTELPENEMLVTAIQYVNASPKPDQNCANCGLYSEGDEQAGKCALFQQGRVSAEGWCASWNPKPE